MDIIIRGYIDRGNLSSILIAYMDLFCWTISYSSVREGDRVNRYLASCEYHIIRVHENLVQHPSNNLSIHPTL